MNDEVKHSTESGAAPEAVRDDRVIKQALWWSLWILLGVVGVVGLGVWVLTRKDDAPAVAEKELVLASTQRRDASPPPVRFRDVAEELGLDWRHTNGARGEKLLPETMGPGCGFLDFDGDGALDIALVDAMPWPGDVDASDGGAASPRRSLVLYRNEGGGKRFTNVSDRVELAEPIYGQGLAIGDHDGDGDPDIFLTAVGTNRLLRNDDGRFVDVTAEAGVGGDAREWSTSAAFFDADNDGDLDLFVANYVRWSAEIDRSISHQLTGIGRAYAPPTLFEGTQAYFYRNVGGGRFEEEAEKAGLWQLNAATGRPEAKALGVLPIDFDRDGWMDLFVANDTVRNFLFHNQGDGTFAEDGALAGVAYDSAGQSTGAMGVDAAWYRNDGTLGLAIGNFANEMSSLYVAHAGEGLFSDEAIAEGVGPVSRQMLSFGLFFFDYDLDGRQDLFQANGHLEEEIHVVQPSQQYRQPSQLFWNCGPGHPSAFCPVDAATTGDLARPVVGRAAACGDIDGDGDLDVLIAQTGDRVVLLRNEQALGHHWLRLRLEGDGKRVNRDAIGAVVEVRVDGVTQRQQVMPSRSYLSQVERTLTFGLGDADRASVRIFWPGSSEPDERGELAVDREHTLASRID